jgi:hypothetical protein
MGASMKEKQFGVENADDWPIIDAVIWSTMMIGLVFMLALII